MHQPDLAEVNLKLNRIRKYMERSGLTGVVIARKDNFSWLFGRNNGENKLSTILKEELSCR